MGGAEAFGLFVSSVEGKIVARYGTNQLLGAIRTKKGVRWLPEQVVALTQDEARRYRREYRKAIDQGALVQRTADDWLKACESDQPKKATSRKKRADAPAPQE